MKYTMFATNLTKVTFSSGRGFRLFADSSTEVYVPIADLNKLFTVAVTWSLMDYHKTTLHTVTDIIEGEHVCVTYYDMLAIASTLMASDYEDTMVKLIAEEIVDAPTETKKYRCIYSEGIMYHS